MKLLLIVLLFFSTLLNLILLGGSHGNLHIKDLESATTTLGPIVFLSSAILVSISLKKPDSKTASTYSTVLITTSILFFISHLYFILTFNSNGGTIPILIPIIIVVQIIVASVVAKKEIMHLGKKRL